MPAAQASFLPETKTPAADNLTPLMAQYRAIKARHADCLLFFRLGDFYELFFDDAVRASKALDLVLTRRGQHQGQDVPMCGVPAHAYENYLAKLIRAGFRVAICEQSETPEQAKARAKRDGGKTIVAREVVRIVTPGTITEDNLLETNAANHLACLTHAADRVAVAWCDINAGTVQTQLCAPGEVAGLLAAIEASEILIAQRLVEHPDLFETFAPWRARLTVQPHGRFDVANARRRLMEIYRLGDLGVFGELAEVEYAALGALLDYVALTQKTDLRHFRHPRRAAGGQMTIDAATRRNLELTRTMTGAREGSLLDNIDRTETGAGARLLAARLAAPLTDPAAIAERLDAVGFFAADERIRAAARRILRACPDIERALARIALGRGGPRDLAALRDALAQGEAMRRLLLDADALPPELAAALRDLGEHNALRDRLTRALAPELPLLARDGGFIAKGYAPQLDELTALRDDGRRLIAGLQQKYAEAGGVPNLKIKHNQIIGYHVEVAPAQADRLLAMKDLFIHRQTLATAARFATVELGELERKISEAGDKALAVELRLFADLTGEVISRAADLGRAARALATLDVAAGLAELAATEGYARPMVDASTAFAIAGGRHPVVEQALRRMRGHRPDGAVFIANDCDLGGDRRLWLLTGPNMAGKSTFLRQNALIAVLAQIGSFVPAASAHIGVVDRLFSRVGAADDLAAGRSTFMVEMVETAAILHQAGPRALVILDEIGRGTATYDGLSIAWAVLEHLHETNQCRALFATHYHELTALQATLPALHLATMRIREWDNRIVFLHEVVPGSADRSYGLHVATMAGLPQPVIARAGQLLTRLERDRDAGTAAELPPYDPQATVPAPVKSLTPELDALLKTLDPDALTPRDALDALYKIKAAV